MKVINELKTRKLKLRLDIKYAIIYISNILQDYIFSSILKMRYNIKLSNR